MTIDMRKTLQLNWEIVVKISGNAFPLVAVCAQLSVHLGGSHWQIRATS
jgi:hypothetical protein